MSASALRVGVSGHRALSDPAAVARDVDVVLDRLVADHDGGDIVSVSSLAEGADRIVAARVLARAGGRLEVILPLAVDDYSTDFADDSSRQEFHDLLGAARHHEVAAADPADDSREGAYARAGTAVLDACDVLLALWDGWPARGRGGTSEVVAVARKRGQPVEVVTVRRAE